MLHPQNEFSLHSGDLAIGARYLFKTMPIDSLPLSRRTLDYLRPVTLNRLHGEMFDRVLEQLRKEL